MFGDPKNPRTTRTTLAEMFGMLIAEYLSGQPNQESDDQEQIRRDLRLTDAQFSLGVRWLIDNGYASETQTTIQ